MGSIQIMKAATASSQFPVVVWLGMVCILIMVTVTVGGITRLTGSGLSMVDWKPIMGAIPPVSETDWKQTFDAYKAYPEYKILNRDMSLSEFKVIFFWEYIHRLAGRLIGILFIVPYLWFIANRRVRGRLGWKLGLAFVLGGMQGLLGWYMVRSGMVNFPYISHYRLAAHLSLALALLAYLVWIILDLIPRSTEPGRKVGILFPLLAGIFSCGLVVQIEYGALMAGLKAGFMFNTFPTILGFWIPPGLLTVETVVENFFQNPMMVHFIHRWLGGGLVILAGLVWLFGRRRTLDPRARWFLRVVPLITGAQFMLGVVTLVLVVPLAMAAMHQVVAALLVVVTAGLLHDVLTPPMGSYDVIEPYWPESGIRGTPHHRPGSGEISSGNVV